MLKKTYLLMTLCILISHAHAQNTPQTSETTSPISPISAYDCTMVALDSGAGEMLTKSERIAQMDNSLQDSIDKHDQCVEQVVTNNTAANSSGSTGSGAEESEGGVSNGIGSGNENEANAGNTAEQSNSESETNNAEGDDRPEPSRNGAKNQEIAPKDNDSAVCRLLKDELKIEADPKKQNELKEIYSNYDCRG